MAIKRLQATGNGRLNYTLSTVKQPFLQKSVPYAHKTQDTDTHRHKWNPSQTWNWKHNLPTSHFKWMFQCRDYSAEAASQCRRWRWRRCEQTSHQDILHGASSNHGRQPLAPSCHADYWLQHIPQSCDSTYHEAPLSAPESLTPGMGLPWHEITILAMYDLRVMGAAVCNHTSSIFGYALFGHALFKNLHCNVSIILWSPSGYQAGAITILGVCCGTELSCDNFTSQLCYLTPGETELACVR